MIYDEIINKLNIEDGEKIWLSSDITRYMFCAKRNGEEFSAERLLDAVCEQIGSNGTLMLPVFSFEFSNHGIYDYCNTKGTCGYLGNFALKKDGFKRTLHPMHSFVVWGADQERLCTMENKHSFGEDSPFAYCRDNNVRQIMLGTDYQRAMTYVHFVETECAVPYRFPKTFKGIYIDENGKQSEREYLYAARRLDVGTKEEFNRIGDVLEKKGVAYSTGIWEISNYSVELAKSYPWIREDIMKNKCRNIYDFDVERDELFAGFGG